MIDFGFMIFIVGDVQYVEMISDNRGQPRVSYKIFAQCSIYDPCLQIMICYFRSHCYFADCHFAR